MPFRRVIYRPAEEFEAKRNLISDLPLLSLICTVAFQGEFNNESSSQGVGPAENV